jgi:hypothetical protein
MSSSAISALLLALVGSSAQASDPESLILTYKDYAKIKHDVPYVLEFKCGTGGLLLYGGRHVFDPADPQIADIEKEWQRYGPDVAYNEGGNPPTESAPANAVKRFGEPGLVRYLAAREHVPVATFEPKEADEISALRKEYSAEQVKVFLALRTFLTFRKSKHEQSADQYMNGILGRTFLGAQGLAGTPKNVPELEAACRRLFPGLKDWRDVPEDWFDPTQAGQFTNEAQNTSGMCRDRHIFKLLVQRAKKNERVFAVIGASHVPVMEAALVAALGQPARKRNGTTETSK